MMKDVTEIKNFDEYEITIGIGFLNEEGEPDFRKTTMTVHTDFCGRGDDLQAVADFFGVDKYDVQAEMVEYESVSPDSRLDMFGIRGFVSRTKETDYNPEHENEKPLFVYKDTEDIERRVYGPVIFIRSELRDLDTSGYLDLNDGTSKYILDDEIYIRMVMELGYNINHIDYLLLERDPEVVQCYIKTRRMVEEKEGVKA